VRMRVRRRGLERRIIRRHRRYSEGPSANYLPVTDEELDLGTAYAKALPFRIYASEMVQVSPG
jgi:hypothetical protein